MFETIVNTIYTVDVMAVLVCSLALFGVIFLGAMVGMAHLAMCRPEQEDHQTQ